MFKWICSECSATQRRKTYDDRYKCIRCDSNQKPLQVTEELIKSTKGLIRLGIKLSEAHTYEVHNSGNVTMRICFFLCVPYPENILQLPQEWSLKYDTSGTVPVYELRSSYEQSNIDGLEYWIRSKNVEGFKSILSLAGYL